MTSTEIASATKIMLGSTEAIKMYIGSTLIWNSWNPDTNGYAYVDLGLPSGTLWATMNVGANSEEDGGLYFQWGDTQGYTASQVGVDKVFNKSTYKYYDGTTKLLYDEYHREDVYTKYNCLDFKVGLEDQDDAAHVNMGGDWHIPSKVHWDEMLNNTTKEIVEINQKACVKYTGTNGKYIIIPCCGEALNSNVVSSEYGEYWLDSIFAIYLGQDDGRCAMLYSDGSYDYGYTGSNSRYLGRNIRAVLYKPRQILTDQELSYSSSEVRITSNNTTLPYIINTNNVEIDSTLPVPRESFIVRDYHNDNLSIDTSKGSGICQIGSTFIGDFVYKAKAIGYRAIMLPVGYTELEYISSSSGGNQYIDLGIKLYETLNTNYDIAMKFNIASGNANQAAIFACQDSDTDPWPGTFVRVNSSSGKAIGRYIGGTAKDNTLGNLGADIELPVQTSPNKNVTSLNNNNTTHQYGTSLFCAFVGGTNTPARYCNAKLYYFKLFVGGTLVRDLIPCKNSNNVVGMYDVVNNVFYTSPNGNAFVAGPAV